MTDQNPVLLQGQGNQPDIVDIGTVAAQNLALALKLPESHVGTIKQAIKDEINAMSAHFTMAFADIRDQHEIELSKLEKEGAAVKAAFEADVEVIKSEFSYIAANPGKIAIAISVLLGIGALIGHFA